ncbi:MAG: putative transposase [Acetobacteraceae bacterium]|nr:putative transposase [Acetobacteraceae bacterium]
MSNHLPLTSMPMQTGSAPQLPLLVRDCDRRQLFKLLQVEIGTMVRHEFIRNRIGLPSARGVGLQGGPRDVENYPSVPTMMRHRPPESLDPQTRKDFRIHAHAPSMPRSHPTDAESATLFKPLFHDVITKHNVPPGQLTLHADRGSPMKATATAFLLADLGVTRSHNRPHTSSDKPFSESHFKTLKYQSRFPKRFGLAWPPGQASPRSSADQLTPRPRGSLR